MATKKAVKKTTKKPATRKTVKKTTVSKKNDFKKQDEALYFWGGILIAVCAAGAFFVLALGINQML